MPEADRYYTRLSAGLCVACGTGEPLAGVARCVACAESVRQLNAARRERLRAKKLCVKCGAARVVKERQYCAPCLAYFAARAT